MITFFADFVFLYLLLHVGDEVLFELLVDPGHLDPICGWAAKEGNDDPCDGEASSGHCHQAGEEEVEGEKEKEACGLDEEAFLYVLVCDDQVVPHVARKLKDTPEDDPRSKEEAWKDPNGKADKVEAESYEGKDGGKRAEDGDDDAGVSEAERNPQPAAGARPQFLLPVRVVVQPVGELLDRFKSTFSVGFKSLINPLPVR